MKRRTLYFRCVSLLNEVFFFFYKIYRFARIFSDTKNQNFRRLRASSTVMLYARFDARSNDNPRGTYDLKYYENVGRL